MSAATVLRVNDLPVARQLAVEAQAYGVGFLDGRVIDRLEVEMWFRAVAGVPTVSEKITGGYMLSRADGDAAALKVAQCDDDAIAALDEDVVACQSLPPGRCSTTLRECVADRGETPIRRMIGLAAVQVTTMPSTGARTGRPKPGNLAAGSGRTSDPRLRRAVRPASSTGTKSIA